MQVQIIVQLQTTWVWLGHASSAKTIYVVFVNCRKKGSVLIFLIKQSFCIVKKYLVSEF